MTKLTCDVVQDILPLYAEGLASGDSRRLVEAHLEICDACRKQLDAMRSHEEFPADTDAEPLRRLKRLLQRKKAQTVVMSVLAALCTVVIVIGYLVSPVYIPYSMETVALTQNSDGTVLAAFGNGATGYGVSDSPADDGSGMVYHIAAWDSVWGRTVNKNVTSNTVLNPEGQKAAAVYYYETDGSGERLIAGTPQNPSGVVIRQPRLLLCSAAAMGLTVICGAAAWLLRGRKCARNNMLKALLVPVSYLLSQLCVMGLAGTSHSPIHDFFTILLVMLPVYTALLLLVWLVSRRQNAHMQRT